MLEIVTNEKTRLLRRSRRARTLRENLIGFGFILPGVLLILAFTVYPLFFSLRISFQRWNPIIGGTNIGLENYRGLLTDTLFKKAMTNNLWYALWTILGGFVFSYGAALLVKSLKIRKTLRFFFFIPSICSTIMITMLWAYMLQSDIGLVNTLLRMIGISDPPNWIANSKTAPMCLYFIVVWSNLGYWMVVFMTGLLDIPDTYYEAAKLDGATGLQQLIHITLPLSTPIIFFYLSMALITCWGQFDIATTMAMYSGTIGTGSSNSLLMPAYLIYNYSFNSMNFGYSAAMGWGLTLFIIVLSIINNRVQRWWVCYDK